MNQIRSTGSALLFAGLTLGVLPGCRAPTAPEFEAFVQTTQPVYGIPTGSSMFRFEASVINSLDDTIILDSANRDLGSLEKWVSGAWRLAYSPVYTDQGRIPVYLGPGQTRQLQVWLNLIKAPNTYPTFKYDIPGTYRGVYRFERAGSFMEVYSNPFELRWAK
ncbi:MAG: hypothetical protein NUW01_20010 [Gemmatimonadaceae bacterium]|nr:hypothetical protein [Gemmatimonadaceae bacterium]